MKAKMTMKHYELFNLVNDDADYKNVGKNIQYKIIRVKNVIYILYQGSKDTSDWLFNIRFIPSFGTKAYKGMNTPWSVHKGFKLAFKCTRESLKTDLTEIISSIKEDEKLQLKPIKIICSGHSMGGALAQLAAEYISYTFGIKPDLITFASPNPLYGKKSVEYVNSMIGKSVHYRRKNDWVGLLPPNWMNFYCTAKHTVIKGSDTKNIFKIIFKIISVHCYGYGDEDNYKEQVL